MEDNNEPESRPLTFAEIADAAIANSLWAVPDVNQQPSLHPWCWTVRELPNGHRHLCAWLGYEGRVSSAVSQWLPDEKILVTNSGRRYKLDGQVRSQGDAEYVWAHWCSIQGFDPENFRDVSADYLPD
ncbi:MAG: hypothetical protein WBZ04_03890 [Candidatus Nanopelagicales bacterium]|jgi:hypothetical protein